MKRRRRASTRRAIAKTPDAAMARPTAVVATLLPHEERDDLARSGSQCTYAKLSRPGRDTVGDDAKQTDAGEHESQRRGAPEIQGGHAVASQLARAFVLRSFVFKGARMECGVSPFGYTDTRWGRSTSQGRGVHDEQAR